LSARRFAPFSTLPTVACQHACERRLVSFLPLQTCPAAHDDEPPPVTATSTLKAAPRDDSLKAEPEGRSVPKVEAEGRNVLTSEAKPSVLTSAGRRPERAD
jgi:hypothetical protein